MKLIKHLLVIASVFLATAACTSSGKDAKDKGKEETGMPERASALLPRKDSIALAKLYQDYEKAVDDLNHHTEIFDEEYNLKLEKLKTDFETSLTSNPHYAPVVELRNLLLAYQRDMQKDEEHKYDVEIEVEEGTPEEFVYHEKDIYFQKKWDEKLLKLLQEHPDFMECPPYMFEEALDPGVTVATSADGRIRYYSYLSGEWRMIVSVTCIRQYLTDSGQTVVSMVENDDSWGLVEEVHTLKVKGKTVYLLKKTHSEGRLYTTYNAEAIEGEKIIHPVVFDTEEHKAPYVLYNTDGPEKDWVAKYDEKTKTIYLRVTDRENHYWLSDAYVTYTFDGKMFRFSGQHKD